MRWNITLGNSSGGYGFPSTFCVMAEISSATDYASVDRLAVHIFPSMGEDVKLLLELGQKSVVQFTIVYSQGKNSVAGQPGTKALRPIADHKHLKLSDHKHGRGNRLSSSAVLLL
jgi:hypothetical protein